MSDIPDDKKRDLSIPKPILSRIESMDTSGLALAKMDAPCPKQTAEDISMDHAINEWVLNHLPFRSEEQREDFVKKLIKDQKVKEKIEKKGKAAKEKIKKSKTLGGRVGVKEMTKHIFKTKDEETTEGRFSLDTTPEYTGEGGKGGEVTGTKS